jgi:ectoine hydroxylase-related dioxygenase (phytanoyl-CoA dioxygenase family)
MDMKDHGVSEHVDPLMEDIDRYGLYKHVVELEAYGITVVPPETMRVDEEFVGRLRNAILRACERRNGVEITDYQTSVLAQEDAGRNSWDLLEEDEVFVEAAINPVNLALVHWLLGGSAVFSGQTWIIKGEGYPSLNLHSDAHGIPPGGGHIAHTCNASWLCSDYEDAADGPTVFVPGSHHHARATLPHEEDLATTPFKVVPLVGKAGSLAIWNGATWHGAYARSNPGLRVTLVQAYARSYMRVHRDYENTSPQLLEKYPALKRVIGEPLYPYQDRQNADWQRVGPFMKTGTDPFA